MDLAALITVVVGTTSLSLGWATLLTRTLGERISTLETSMNSRFASLETSMNSRFRSVETSMNSRFGSVETRLNAVESALRDVGERLTTLETDLGKR